MMSDISKWTIFSLLSPEFVENIKFAIVFGSSGNETIIISKDNQAYGIGTNSSSCLGIGNGHCSLEPARIEQISNKEIISLAFGSGPHVLALTVEGELFSWGHNGYSQLGTGNTAVGVIPTPVVSNLGQRRVAQIACGNHHSMALTSDGEVYAWGQSANGQIGSGCTSNQPSPRLVAGSLALKVVKSIACGQTSSFAIADCGELFAWGYNGNGQLGVGNNTNQLLPIRVHQLNGNVVHQLVCGFAHVLALTDEGDLYAWGSNSCGQLGSGNRSNQLIPIRIAEDLGRITHIAAVHACNITAARTHAGRIYMWGQCRGQSITTPQETRFTCIDDVFACFASPPVCYRPIIFALEKASPVHENIRLSFDDAMTSDVCFLVEGKAIHVHKAILKIRCQHFRSMFQRQWNEGDRESIEIHQFPYPVYRAFLFYLYTGEVDLAAEDAIGLLDLANSYCEVELKEKCVHIIRHSILIENAIMLYAAALKFEATELKEFCFNFCLNHMTAVIQTEAFQKLDEHSLKNFVVEAAKRGAFKS